MPKVRFTPGHGMASYRGADYGTGEPVFCVGPSVIEVSDAGADYLCSTFVCFTREGEVRPAPLPSKDTTLADEPEQPRRRRGRPRKHD